MLPMVNEANAMSEELDKKVKFEVALIAPQARGLKDGRTEVNPSFTISCTMRKLMTSFIALSRSHSTWKLEK